MIYLLCLCNWSVVNSDDEDGQGETGVVDNMEGEVAPEGSDDENMAEARKDGEG